MAGRKTRRRVRPQDDLDAAVLCMWTLSNFRRVEGEKDFLHSSVESGFLLSILVGFQHLLSAVSEKRVRSLPTLDMIT